jgi:cyclopropane-fatty-acyl-phospholipid synthase
MRTDNESSVADTMRPMLEKLLGDPLPVDFEFWDGSTLCADGGDHDGDHGDAVHHTVRATSADALRHIAWAPGELGFARAYVCGDLDTDGDLAETMRAFQASIPDDIVVAASALPTVLSTARSLGALTPRPTPPPEEVAPRGVRHSIRRDRQAVSHHYDVGNDFYRLVLGPAMTYSCARFVTPETSLADAQAAKHELICRKLGLADATFRNACRHGRPRLLDVGCGWGSMALHAAAHHDVDVVGITISAEQADLARKRAADAGLGDRIEIRLQDYREVDDGPFDAISSIGMAEHVGARNMVRYFSQLYGLVRDGGRVLNHAIASVGGSRMSSRSFVGRYVFPDGELLDLADTIKAMERVGFEVRDVENLREHYAETLRRWVANLDEHWSEAVALVGSRRARVWRLYMSGSINGFDDNGLQLYQTLGVRSVRRPTDLPATRRDWD